MRIDLNDVFQELQPPPGGWVALRERLDREPARSRRLHFASAAAIAVAVLAIVVVVILNTGPQAAEPLAITFHNRIGSTFSPALVRLGVVDPPERAVSIPAEHRDRIAVQLVPVGDPDVLYYRFAVLDVDGGSQ